MLKLNDSKTEYIITASSHNMNTLWNITSEPITPSSTIKNLDITFDSAMTLSDYIISLCKSVNLLLRKLIRIRRLINHTILLSNSTRALILSKLDYGNALLSGCKIKDVVHVHLQRLQNRTARIVMKVFQVPRRHPSAPPL